MSNHIIDCCSLINLYTGWGNLNELGTLNWHWHVCDAVLNEAEYTREYGADGKPTLVKISLAETQPGLLKVASIENDLEMADYVDFASEMDDGEAQALAIAKHRGFVLLTDDNKAIKVARRPEVGVQVLTTAQIWRLWSQKSKENELRLPTVIERITTLARFRPKPGSSDFLWWNSY